MSFEHPWIGELLYEGRRRDELARAERARRLEVLRAARRRRGPVRTTLGAAVIRGGGWIAGETMRVYVDCSGRLAVDA